MRRIPWPDQLKEGMRVYLLRDDPDAPGAAAEVVRQVNPPHDWFVIRLADGRTLERGSAALRIDVP